MANQDLLRFLVRVISEYYNYIILSNVPTRRLAIYFMALTVGIEPTTYGLQIRCTTIVLRQHLLVFLSTKHRERRPMQYVSLKASLSFRQCFTLGIGLAVTVELESTPVDYETTILPLYYITIRCNLN